MAPSGLPTSANSLLQTAPVNLHIELQKAIHGLVEICDIVRTSLQKSGSSLRYLDSDQACNREVALKKNATRHNYIIISRTDSIEVGPYQREIEIEEIEDVENGGCKYRCRSPLSSGSDMYVYGDGTIGKNEDKPKALEPADFDSFNLLFLATVSKVAKDIDMQRNLINISTSTNAIYMPKLRGLVEGKKGYISNPDQDVWEGKDKEDNSYMITKLKKGPDHGQTRITRIINDQLVELSLNGNNKLIAKKVNENKASLSVSDVTEFAAWLTDVVVLLGKA